MKNKCANWEHLEKFFVKAGIPISNDLINDLMHQKPNAGMQFIEIIYPLLTNKKLERSLLPSAADDSSVPSFLRPTASKLIKESVSDLELQYKKSSPEYLAKTAEDIMAKQRSENKVERADATSERLLSTTLGADKSAKVQRLATQRPLNEQLPLEQVEFKEIQIKSVEIDVARLRNPPRNTSNTVPVSI